MTYLRINDLKTRCVLFLRWISLNDCLLRYISIEMDSFYLQCREWVHIDTLHQWSEPSPIRGELMYLLQWASHALSGLSLLWYCRWVGCDFIIWVRSVHFPVPSIQCLVFSSDFIKTSQEQTVGTYVFGTKLTKLELLDELKNCFELISMQICGFLHYINKVQKQTQRHWSHVWVTGSWIWVTVPKFCIWNDSTS